MNIIPKGIEVLRQFRYDTTTKYSNGNPQLKHYVPSEKFNWLVSQLERCVGECVTCPFQLECIQRFNEVTDKVIEKRRKGDKNEKLD